MKIYDEIPEDMTPSEFAAIQGINAVQETFKTYCRDPNKATTSLYVVDPRESSSWNYSHFLQDNDPKLEVVYELTVSISKERGEDIKNVENITNEIGNTLFELGAQPVHTIAQLSVRGNRKRVTGFTVEATFSDVEMLKSKQIIDQINQREK